MRSNDAVRLAQVEDYSNLNQKVDFTVGDIYKVRRNAVATSVQQPVQGAKGPEGDLRES